MKRDWDVIREILIRLEEATSEDDCLRLSSFPPERAHEISYHAELLMEADLINGQMSKTLGPGPYDFFAEKLTWNGHEFLDAIRSDTIWQKTKNSFLSKGLSITFDLVKSVAVEVASAYLKTSAGG
jgi:hypothetical protein